MPTLEALADGIAQHHFAAIPAVIYLAVGLPVTGGPSPFGTLIAFTTLQNSLFRPTTRGSVISSLALFARIFEYLDLPFEVDAPPRPVRIDPAPVTGHVAFAHRLSTVRNADQIVVLDHGRIVEAGDHTTLLAGQGRYAELAA